jgi:hypothetical protein
MATIGDESQGAPEATGPNSMPGETPASDITTPTPESTAQAQGLPEPSTGEVLSESDLRTLSDANAAAAERDDPSTGR